jgi:hypothetical protein
MTVNQAIIVCEVLKQQGFGDYELTSDGGFVGMCTYPNEYSKENKIINMEGGKKFGLDEWQVPELQNDLIQVCDEIEEALKGAGLT